ncbi:MAG: disulfide bond formation protein DsbD [Proteobacteria bacterium]|nr:disulfide bond formation protein DsbD [Pseudomonadota bacterium]
MVSYKKFGVKLMSCTRFFRVLIPVILMFFCTQVQAASTEWFKNDEISLRVIAGGYVDNNNDKLLQMGLHFTLAPHWKTYYRSPGDGGLPVKIEWTKTENVEAPYLIWPTPTRYVEVEAVQSFGYKDELVLPIYAKVIDPTKPVKIALKADYAVCNEICIFFKKDFELEIPANHSDDASKELINRYVSYAPKATLPEGFEITEWTVSNENKTRGTLVVKAKTNVAFQNPDLIIEGPEYFRFPTPEVTLSQDKKSATFEVNYQISQEGKSLLKTPLNMILADGHKAIEKSVTFADISNKGGQLLYILLVAFLGGLILNVMPCVLPVLSIKLLSVIKHSESHVSTIRTSFLASAAGIVSSFLLLALLVTSLKAAGTQVGWGFQFQNTTFLVLMVLILSVFASNLWGLFEVGLPSWVGNKLASSKKANEHSLTGHFLSGVLATVLATPCSAPLVGTAIGFAFSQGALAMFAIFTAMGIGLAAPYLIFSLFPAMVKKLPKPGAWMIKVKYVLGTLLFITVVWVSWVITGQHGPATGITVLFCAALIPTLLVLGKMLPASIPHKWVHLVIVLVALIAFAAPTVISTTIEKPTTLTEWVPFDKSKIAPLVSEGRVVMVDVTADWCLTCKANKLLVLDRPEVVKILSNPRLVTMKADWTNPSEEITAYLKSFGRYGIPFNVIYGPKAPEGIPLPELLTQERLENALEQAGLEMNK